MFTNKCEWVLGASFMVTTGVTNVGHDLPGEFGYIIICAHCGISL